MWLLNASTRQLEKFDDDRAVEEGYAVLSHTWGKEHEEVTFDDLRTSKHVWDKKGFMKLDFTCRQALLDGIQYAWIDTCCINKSSSTELSEAINSMFKWYKKSRKCYAFLADVSKSCPYLGDGIFVNDPRLETGTVSRTFFKHLKSSKWFTRGWTLQELLAPREVVFFAESWKCIGTKDGLVETLADITNIDPLVLTNVDLMKRMSIATRMSWAADRTTTRPEDRAYSLFGIFDVNLPMLYGDGLKAFERLQEEIMKLSTDHSILLWQPQTTATGERLLAESPADFRHARNVVQYTDLVQDSFGLTNSGLRITLPIITINQANKRSRIYAITNCRYADNFTGVIAFEAENMSPLRSCQILEGSQDLMIRPVRIPALESPIVIVPSQEVDDARRQPLLIVGDQGERKHYSDFDCGFSFWLCPDQEFRSTLTLVEAQPHRRWNPYTWTMTWPISWTGDVNDCIAYVTWMHKSGQYITVILQARCITGLKQIHQFKLVVSYRQPDRAYYFGRSREERDWSSVDIQSAILSSKSVQVRSPIGPWGDVELRARQRVIERATVCVLRLEVLNSTSQETAGRAVDPPMELSSVPAMTYL